MAFPTAVNSQITDAVTQSNVKVLSESPAMALSNVYMVLSQAIGAAAQNAATSQQQNNVTAQAATSACVAFLLGTEPEETKK